jgi:hypothetical protein
MQNMEPKHLGVSMKRRKSKSRGRMWICLMALSALTGTCAWGQIYVSPQGDDSHAGTSTQPVASLAKAVELSRTLSAGAGQQKRIVLRQGTYFDVGITLGPADSSLIIESDESAAVTLAGGVALTGWEKEPGQFWSAALPAGRIWDVRLLQVEGRFCPRARFPEQGTLTHSSVFNVPWMSTTGGGWKRKPTEEELTTLQYREGDIPADLDIRNAEITVFHMWDESVAGIAAHDVGHRKLKLSPPLGHPPGAFGVQKYCLWNLRQGMTRPGQWYFDRGRNRIVYWPLAGEDMRTVRAVVPTRQEIIRIAGATNVTLNNLSMRVTTVPLITGGFAAAAFSGAVQLVHATDTALLHLKISNVAGQAIKGLGDQNSTRVLDCAISGCGAGGVYLSGRNNVVSNNVIHAVGLMFPSAMAIQGGGAACKLSHNEIYDTPYSAIGFGGRDVIIENNRITDCMKVLHDGAAIYCFGAKRAILRNNFAHDILDTGGYGASAYYLDEQSQDCVVENNLSVNVARPSHNHMATNNVIRNNVFISRGDMKLTFPRCTGYRLEGNVLYSGGIITLEGINNVASWSKNIVYSKAGKIEGTQLKDYSTIKTVAGVSGDTLAADPRFLAVDDLNLLYAPQSPALQMGLKPLSPSMAGPVSGKVGNAEKRKQQ